jgi:hypothetical protein
MSLPLSWPPTAMTPLAPLVLRVKLGWPTTPNLPPAPLPALPKTSCFVAASANASARPGDCTASAWCSGTVGLHELDCASIQLWLPAHATLSALKPCTATMRHSGHNEYALPAARLAVMVPWPALKMLPSWNVMPETLVPGNQ